MATKKQASARPDSIHVEIVVDTPGGSRIKYHHDESRDVFVLHKLLPVGASFPFDFGYVPGTKAEDGDPIDVIVVAEETTFAGCRIPVRLLGVIEAEQTGKDGTIRNDRLVAVPETEKIHPRERTLEDLTPGLVDQLEHFFVAYNQAEGRTFKPISRGGPRTAARLVAEARTGRR